MMTVRIMILPLLISEAKDDEDDAIIMMTFIMKTMSLRLSQSESNSS